MATLTSYETGQDGDGFIGDGSGDEYDKAQSFQITTTDWCGSVQLYLKAHTTAPTDPITVCISTDTGAGAGTLTDPSATTTIPAASLTTSYAWVTATFPSSFKLLGSTTYYLKAYIGNQSNDVRFLWGRDESSPGYTSGSEFSSMNGAAYSADTAKDFLFKVISGIPTGSFLYSSL